MDLGAHVVEDPEEVGVGVGLVLLHDGQPQPRLGDVLDALRAVREAALEGGDSEGAGCGAVRSSLAHSLPTPLMRLTLRLVAE